MPSPEPGDLIRWDTPGEPRYALTDASSVPGLPTGEYLRFGVIQPPRPDGTILVYEPATGYAIPIPDGAEVICRVEDAPAWVRHVDDCRVCGAETAHTQKECSDRLNRIPPGFTGFDVLLGVQLTDTPRWRMWP